MLSVSLLWLALVANASHLYYSIDRSTRYVGDSPSMKEITDCKDQCMRMNQHYRGLHFRFHRHIRRQATTDIKYFEGECQWSKSTDDKSFKGWQFLHQKDTRWQRYSLQCDNPQLKLSNQLVKSLKLTRTHSDFLYYDSGRFVNLQPFDDLPGLFKRVTELQSKMNSK